MKVNELIEQLQKLPSCAKDLDVVIYDFSDCMIDDFFHIKEIFYDDGSQLGQKIYLKPDYDKVDWIKND